MFAISYRLEHFISDLLKSRAGLKLENLFLCHQLNIIMRRPSLKLGLSHSDFSKERSFYVLKLIMLKFF